VKADSSRRSLDEGGRIHPSTLNQQLTIATANLKLNINITTSRTALFTEAALLIRSTLQAGLQHKIILPHTRPSWN
jgi:hypothetical protein